MNVYIKNIHNSNLIFRGREVTPGAYLLIPEIERPAWGVDDNIFNYISNDQAQIAKTDDGQNDIQNKTEQWDFLKNLIPPKVSLSEQDADTGGVQFTPRYAPPGWMQQLFELEFTTSKPGTIHEKDRNNADIGWASLKFFKDDNGTEIELPNLTAPELALCTRTDLLWAPNIDYMILSGKITQIIAPNADVFVWGVGVDLDPAYGGPQVTFAEGGINMDYVSPRSAVGLNGVAGTILYKDKVWDAQNQTYVTLGEGVGTNRMKFTVRHPAGMEHRFQTIFEIFKA